jgi:hypothetical protein
MEVERTILSDGLLTLLNGFVTSTVGMTSYLYLAFLMDAMLAEPELLSAESKSLRFYVVLP